MNSTVDFLNNPWRPVKNRIIKSNDLAEKILTDGFAIVNFASDDQIKSIQELYDKEHNVNATDGGMFYSLYSQNTDYRWTIHRGISEVLKPSLDTFFEGYKEMVNTFIAKLPGPRSEFFIHQDTTGLDEHRYSPLSIWLPLDDVDAENGSMSVLPKSHQFFTPYRGISFGYPFDDIKEELLKYMIPLSLKKGEALIFDPRVVHNSAANTSNSPRIVSLTGLFPKSATFRHCYLDKSVTPSILEIYEQDDNFLIEYPHLLIDCTERPSRGNLVQKLPYSVPKIAQETFEELCKKFNVNRVRDTSIPFREDCIMIGEPELES